MTRARAGAVSEDDLETLRAWVGRTVEAEDIVTPSPLARAAATLDRDDPPPRPGDPVPPAWHWFFFLPTERQADLGADGHARRGDFLPPVPLTTRLWAGGRMRFERPLRVGQAIRRRSEVIRVDPKTGRSGRLVFVTVRHTVSGPDGVATTEEHDIVYRDPPRPGAKSPDPQPAATQSSWRRSIRADATLLFRFSALTFNGYRLHYDHRYCDEHGYPGLVVHGPLTVILLLDLVRRERPELVLKSLDYRMLRALYDTQPFTLAGKHGSGHSLELWAADDHGALATLASATYA